SLATSSSSELSINPPRIVTFSSNYSKSTFFFYSSSQFNIGSTTSHVGCNGNSTWFTRFSNNFCFFLMVFGVKNLVRYLFHFEHPTDQLGNFNSRCSNQNWPALFP